VAIFAGLPAEFDPERGAGLIEILAPIKAQAAAGPPALRCRRPPALRRLQRPYLAVKVATPLVWKCRLKPTTAAEVSAVTSR